MTNDTTPEGPNPSGLCMCGCGGVTTIATENRPSRHLVRGQHIRYISGHNRAKTAPEYVIDDNGCWVWQRHIGTSGYAQMQDRQSGGCRHVKAHRVYYERAKGLIPSGLQLDHLCRNRACVNPDHLEAVTRVENIRRGARVKLTSDNVRAIRARIAEGESVRDIAIEFGVSATNVSSIRHMRSWRDV